MSHIILPIRKNYCCSLFSGRKRYEFRKMAPINSVSTIYVYESRGCGKVIGELNVTDILIDTPEEIWNRTKEFAGIDRESFFEYFKGKTQAVAFVISSAVKYEEPISISKFGLSRPPQNYCWVKHFTKQ